MSATSLRRLALIFSQLATAELIPVRFWSG
ncbi:hypothetical protein B0E53_03387 [Micromonospora sp. MH33]|nr:hypothetical protein B0E53_03387 [Micromonospora sp. MH33]